MSKQIETDILVVGSGIAGLLFALRVSRFARVTIATKKDIFEANTNYAQGGLAAPVDPGDSPAAHVRDTLACGDGLCDERVVNRVIADAASVVEELTSLGVPWSHKNGKKLDLSLEGGHSARRIVHAKDFTGKALEETLAHRVKSDPNIKVLENTLVLDLALKKDPAKIKRARENRALGALVLTARGLMTITSRYVVLASGGAGKVYFYTTNPDIATGDGMAMAYRAGCALSNLEFVQFHPTCLHHPKARNFLISEAVRGEGGVLRNFKGQAFMKQYDPRADLAPRDIVARAIDDQMKKTGADYVLLDITHRKKSFLKKRFPNIFERLRSLGIDMSKEPIPVVPAAHYFCGGVPTDAWGKTELPGLYAIGEVASTGLHGANRLASNSLLEACAFARYASQAIEQEFSQKFSACHSGESRNPESVPIFPTKWGKKDLSGTDAAILITHNWDEVRRIMANYVSIVRSEERLSRALKRLRVIESEVKELVAKFQPTKDLAELANIALLARLIVKAALWRKESRGLHYMLDYPARRNKFKRNSFS